MNEMTTFVLSLATFAFAYLGVGLWRQFALSRSLLDVPNVRSSHTRPTPRGGGVAIVTAFFIGLTVLEATGRLSLRDTLTLVCAGGIVAAAGFADDFGSLSVSTRLFGHLVASISAIAGLGGAPAMVVFGRRWYFGFAGDVLGVIYLVWLLNLYNFMDGIDGIAAAEAVSVCMGATILLLARDPSSPIWPVSLLLGSAALGFLLWNFPKAKVFMGDVGSGFLGFVIGVLSIMTAFTAPELLWCWLILLGVFVVDATVTLARRISRRERFYQAHRSHAYQRAARAIGAHQPVTWFVAAINVGWLLPLALAVSLGRLEGALGLTIAYIPLVVIAVRFKAGVSEIRDT